MRQSPGWHWSKSGRLGDQKTRFLTRAKNMDVITVSLFIFSQKCAMRSSSAEKWWYYNIQQTNTVQQSRTTGRRIHFLSFVKRFFFFCQYWATCNSRRHRDALCPFLGTKWKKTKKQISENKREQENRRLNDGRGGFMFRSNRRTNSTESVWNILFFTTSDHVGSGGLLFHTSHCFLWPRVNDRVVNEKYSKTHSMFLCKKKKYRCWQLINPRSFLITQTKPLKWLHYWWT